MTENTKTTASSDSKMRAYLLLTMTTICWGGNAVFSKVAVGEVSPMLLVTMRWLGAVLLLFVFASKYLKQDWSVIRSNFWYFFIMGAVGFTGFNSLFYVAAHSTTAVNIGILQGSMPAIVLAGAFIFYRTKIGALQMVGVTTTITGVVIVGIGGDVTRLAELELNIGDLIMLIACFLYSGYTLGLRKRPETSALGLFTAFALAALIASLPLTVAEYSSGQFLWPSTKGWIVIAMITVFPSFLAQIFFIQGVGMIGPGRAGVFINLVPIFASIFAVGYLSEPFELYHGMALAMVLGGIWLSERGKVS
jgi:drug/metabolite transporter (DMT)-like permease